MIDGLRFVLNLGPFPWQVPTLEGLSKLKEATVIKAIDAAKEAGLGEYGADQLMKVWADSQVGATCHLLYQTFYV